MIPTEKLEQIFSSPILFGDSEEETKCKSIVNSLSTDELETAARCSYAYMIAATTTSNESPPPPSEDIREKMAMKMIRRHLVQHKGDVEKALKNIKEVIEFRKEKNMDVLRQCFDSKVFDTEAENELANTYRELIKSEMSIQAMYIRGHDCNNRAIIHREKRTSSHCNEEAFTMICFYIAERAMACTEFMSNGREEKLFVVTDYEGYDSSNTPPTLVIKRNILILQDHYPERLFRLVMIQPPFWMRALWAIVSPFLDPITREKMVLAQNDAAKKEHIEALVSPDQSTKLLHPDGKLTDEIDTNRFLESIPFSVLYDDA